MADMNPSIQSQLDPRIYLNLISFSKTLETLAIAANPPVRSQLHSIMTMYSLCPVKLTVSAVLRSPRIINTSRSSFK
ncbi:hypothetical protein C0995_012368 [Termitomyces sp. Mi166|nr:hypothetical protein C0995_012368 [Termitomyces sp. Mi166\